MQKLIHPTVAIAFAGIATLMATAIPAPAHARDHQHHGGPQQPPPSFQASPGKPFSTLMDDAMQVMDDGMQRAPMNGMADHDFAAMMIPHHQGAVDMAKALLLYTTDPAMRNLAQGIIAEQQIEIQFMQLWLEQHKKGQQ